MNDILDFLSEENGDGRAAPGPQRRMAYAKNPTTPSGGSCAGKGADHQPTNQQQRSVMKRDNPATGAVGSVLDVSKPAISVAAGNIIGTHATNFAIQQFLSGQSQNVKTVAGIGIPLGIGTVAFSMSKKDIVKQFAIGNVLTAVENGLKLVLPTATSGGSTDSGSGDGSGEGVAQPRTYRQLPSRPVNQADSGLLMPSMSDAADSAPEGSLKYSL